MFKIINPTEFTLSVVIKGVPYEVKGNSEISNVPEESAIYWQTNLHAFIKIMDEVTKKEVITPTLSSKSTSNEEDEVSEEVIEETPKKKITKK